MPVSRAALPLPATGPDAAAAWVDAHLGALCGDAASPSPVFRGGQRAADAALASYDVRGYARRRNEVWPESRRGASRLSPYIRHGLLTLARVWDHVEGGPARDVDKFRDELLWQEYARHLYARLGPRLGRTLAWDPRRAEEPAKDPWGGGLACLDAAVKELEQDGWLPNQMRMWLASHWSAREGAHWWEGEERFFRHLLDGSRAANRLGWQWTTGAGNGRPYGFSRWQVRKRAAGLCETCRFDHACPIEDWPETPGARRGAPPGRLARDPEFDLTAGLQGVEQTGTPEWVWLTAESLGRDDPALAAHPELPAVFVFDAPLLERLRLSRKRLVFLVETLADLAREHALEIHCDAPERVLDGRALAATFTPVPGWRRLRERLHLVELHPWPWLVHPHAGSVRSFSAWRRAAG